MPYGILIVAVLRITIQILCRFHKTVGFPSVMLNAFSHGDISLSYNMQEVATSLSPPVPIDISIPQEIRVVTITGPNTGGKTAAMKTLGLATLMAKLGQSSLLKF